MTRRRRTWLFGSLMAMGLIGVAVFARPAPSSAAPYFPSSNDEVLETLPNVVSRAAVSPQREPSAAEAVSRARAEITHYQESADPRFLGRAEAALGAFWDQPSPPEAVLVLRARIRQSNHEFLAALADLDQALGASPDDGQALLDRASIRTVLGRYDAARADCQALAPLTAPLYALVCRSAIDGVTGAAATAQAALTQALSVPGIEAGDRCWAESLLGELASRLGRSADAEAHFRQVLLTCPNDSYARGALADVLLDAKRAPEVVSLLADQTRQDAQLLRLTIAERQTHAASFDAHLTDLEQRFDEARLRGSEVHRREQARFELELHDAAEPALALALANFRVQREPADVRIALEAALAAKRSESVKEVAAFVAASHLEDPRIAALAKRLQQ